MNKARGGDGNPVELFQNAVKVLHSGQQFWKTQQWPQDWKRSVFIPIPKKGSAKECSNYGTTAIILPVHGVLKGRILKWFAIPFSSGPHSVRPLHHDPPILGGPTWQGLVSLS